MKPPRLLPAVLAAILLAPFALAANDLVVGVIASRGVSAGAAQTLVATGWSAELRAAGGVFGAPVKLLLADDDQDPQGAVALAQAQVAAGALALVCCTTSAATQAVAAFAEEAGVTLLATSPLPASRSAYWAFSLAPTDTDVLSAIVADAYRRGRSGLALLAPDGTSAAAAASDLTALGALVGISLVSDTRYPVGQAELRPEALLVASRRPGGVVVWGDGADLARAASALERRGYEGDVYGHTAALYPGEGAPAWRALEGMLFAVPPAAVVPVGSALSKPLPGEQAGGPLGTCADAASRDAGRLAAFDARPSEALATAPVLGGLDLLGAAFEQLLALQVEFRDEAVMRQAVRDALVGLPIRCGGAGALDLEDGRNGAVLPRGLAIGVATPTGLVTR